MSIKVLYVSHFRENSGHSKAAIEHMLALDSVGIEVVPRCIKLNNSVGIVPKRILELENKSSQGCTHIIQHILPHHMEYHGCFKKNIGYFVYETFGLKNQMSSWYAKLQLMDEIWCANESTICEIDDVVKTRCVPHPTDISKYTKDYIKPNIEPANGNFKFYTICDLNKRKNLVDTVRAFHLAFQPHEPVTLLIKTSKYGVSPEQVCNAVSNDFDHIKKNMKLYRDVENYHKEIILSMSMTDEQIYGFHQYCDCFINTSHGEGFSIPTFDAFGFGKRIIIPKATAMYDFPSSNGVYKYNYSDDSIIGYDDTFFELGSARETWIIPNVQDISHCMRFAYEERDQKPLQRQMNKYSYENIGNKMKELLLA